MPISDEVVARALDVARRSPENYRYFFERLNSPEWIEPLEARGLFSDPEPAVVEGGYVTAPQWPPSAFLARVASDAPEAVLRIALNIQTDNERIHEDLTDAALTMPGPLAAEWARQKLVGW